MNVTKVIYEVIPRPQSVLSEVVVVLLGTLGAAFIISKFPKLREFVYQNSPVIRDQSTGGPFIESH